MSKKYFEIQKQADKFCLFVGITPDKVDRAKSLMVEFFYEEGTCNTHKKTPELIRVEYEPLQKDTIKLRYVCCCEEYKTKLQHLVYPFLKKDPELSNSLHT